MKHQPYLEKQKITQRVRYGTRCIRHLTLKESALKNLIMSRNNGGQRHAQH